MSSKKAKGTVRWFNATKGTGFVTLDHGNEYLFFKSGGDHDLNIGDSIEFEVCADRHGRPRAFDITAPGGSAFTGGSNPDGCDAGGDSPSYDGEDFHHGGGRGHNGDGGRDCYISGEEVDALPMWSGGTTLPVFDEMLPSAVVWDEQIGHNVSTCGGLLDLLACGEGHKVDKEMKTVADPDIYDELPHVNGTQIPLELNVNAATPVSVENKMVEKSEMIASKVFDDMLHRDTDSNLAVFNAPIVTVGLAHELFDEKPLSDVIWDRDVSDELFKKRFVPEVIWVEMPTGHAAQEGFDELPYVDVIWDEEVLEQETHNLAMQTHQPNSQSGTGIYIRNLSEKQPGGVIFGCKLDTIEECLTKQLFGLPSDNWADSDAENASVSENSHNDTDEKESGEAVSSWGDLDDNVLQNQFSPHSNPTEASQNSSYKTVYQEMELAEWSHAVVDQVNGERHNFQKDMLVNLHNEYTGASTVDKIENEVHNNPDGVELQPEKQTALKLKESFFIRQQATLSSQYPIDSCSDQGVPV